MVCKEASKFYLKIATGLIIVLGLALLGGGVYGYVEMYDTLAALHEFLPWAGIAFGGLVLAVGAIGMGGAVYQKRPLLLAFFPFAFLVTVIVLAAGALTLVQSGLLDQGTPDTTVDSAVLSFKTKMNDFTMAVYDTCCIDPGYANSTFVPVLVNDTLPKCVDFAQSETAACVIESTDYVVPEEVCTALGQVEENGIKLVGPLPSGCADPFAVKTKVYEAIQENAKVIGIVLLVVSVLMLLLDVFTCVLICTNREDYDEEYRKRKQQQQGTAVVSDSATKYV